MKNAAERPCSTLQALPSARFMPDKRLRFYIGN